MNLILIILVFTVLFGLAGALLGFAAHHFKVEESPVALRLNKVLPQTQCGQCGYAGCRQYAEALAAGEAAIDLCIPGGQSTIDELASVLNVPAVKSQASGDTKSVACIAENMCIGCGKCAASCPVDAIVGAPRMIHAVMESRCTSCRLCVSTCPTGCIAMRDLRKKPEDWNYVYPPLSLQFEGEPQREISGDY
ncbi:MAG: electron transport complex subunit RsxB [Succinivibrionaceae bacterium]|nr:electron transport complex subunit RsxB [Succinivibrionaceae bacterium]